ncbi:S8 family serine peptidase [Anatilimnocola floriformis]|uniref:S8 family serine peptidase n=1 Tax=Anatilimnocola floriformis TaxID=2948575 RepID=UPI0020C1FEC0|nr:S8 family serine peptidase [Anatilimnocola floriformis]
MSFLAQSKKNRQSRRNANSRKDFRRFFLEQLEARQVMTTLTGTTVDPFDPFPPKDPGGNTGGGTFFEQALDNYDGTKVVASDPRVVAWDTASFVTDSFLVRFQEWVTQPEAEATLANEAPGSSLIEWDEDLHSAWVNLPTDSTRQEVLDTSRHFLTLSNTLYAEPNFTRETRRTPNDTRYPLQWNLNNTGQMIPDGTAPIPNFYAGLADADIDAPEAWDLTTGSPNTVIAILDSGYNKFESDMQANYWVNPREIQNGKDDDGNGVIDDFNGYDAAMHDGDPQDDNQTEHGMNVASVAAAPGNDNVGMTGISWNSKLMFVKIEDDTGAITTGGIIGGLNYVTKMKGTFGVNIVSANMSFGGPNFSFSEFDALKKLGAKDVLVAGAVANQGFNHDTTFDSPTGYNVDQLITVTASNAYDEMQVPGPAMIPGGLPEFGYGATQVDIAAPGIDVMLTGFRQIVGPGQITNIAIGTGTSFATPLVAGTAALIRSLAPYLTAVEVKNLIINTADKIPYMNNLNVADGRLNAFTALNSIPKTTISGTVFQDANNDKRQGIGEGGLGGWTVYLDVNNNSVFDVGEPSGVTVTNTTGTGPETGTYAFDAWVNTGTYRVRQVVQTPFTQTTPVTTSNGGAFVITVATRGQDFANVNFGDRMTPGTIKGTKFLDLDGDGVRDPGEPGMQGVLFYVDVNNNGRINVGEPGAYTDINGNFTIPNVQPGTYPVREVLGGGFIPTVPATTNAAGFADPYIDVTVVSGTTTNPPIVFGNRAARDYGDLPESLPGIPNAFSTTIAKGGPSHGILPGFMLGTKQDFEANGIPSVAATGDDNDPTGGPNDEDGLVSVQLVQGQSGFLTFTVTNSNTTSGYLQAWIDFDGDGNFNQATDQIVKNYLASNGLNTVQFEIPANAAPGVTYLRMRYSHDRNLGPNGPAQDGEVEDYQLPVFSDAPIARPDRFPEQLFPPPNDPLYTNDPLIKQETANNPLDVLRNDPLPISLQLKILPGSFPANIDGNLLTLDTSGTRDVLLFTPRGGTNPFTGVYTFTYQVYDPTTYDPLDPLADPSKLSSPTTVQVLVTAKDPRPVDNTFTMVGNVVSNPSPQPVSITMDVLENDVFTPSSPISVGSFTQPKKDPADLLPTGTVTRDTVNPNLLVYTPPTGFVGTVQFTYVATDADPSTLDASATVTIQVTNNPSPPAAAPDAQYLAAISLRVVDARGFVQGVDPGFHIDKNELFFVDVMSEDLRPGGTDAVRGVEAVFLDLLYDKDFAAVANADFDNNGTITPYIDFRALNPGDPVYNLDNNGIVNSPEGVINELGSARDNRATGGPVGIGVKHVVRIGFNATAAGTFRFVADPAEDASERSQVVLAPPTVGDPNPVALQDSQVFLVPLPTITILDPGAPEFVNLRNALDVNGDSLITAFDAITVINELNTYGTRSLQSHRLAAASELPEYYIDVNGDGNVSAFDAIPIINWLNSASFASLHAGEDTSASVAPAASAGEYTAEGSSTGSDAAAPVAASVPTVVVSPLATSSNSSSASSSTGDNSQQQYLSAVDHLMANNNSSSTSNAAATTPSEWADFFTSTPSSRKRFGLRNK